MLRYMHTASLINVKLGGTYSNHYTLKVKSRKPQEWMNREKYREDMWSRQLGPSKCSLTIHFVPDTKYQALYAVYARK